MVLRDNPVARAINETPPRPSSPASTAAHNRLPRSSNSSPSVLYLRAMDASTLVHALFLALNRFLRKLFADGYLVSSIYAEV